MAKTIVEENKDLKRLLYTVEKAVLEFRMLQLEKEDVYGEKLEQVNVPFIQTPDLGNITGNSSIVTSCSCFNEDSVKEILEAIKENQVRQEGLVEIMHTFADTVMELSKIVDRLNKLNEPKEEISEKELTDVSFEETSAPVTQKIEEQVRKPRKERGGEVFTDFKTLSLDNNNFEGNSIVYSKKDELI